MAVRVATYNLYHRNVSGMAVRVATYNLYLGADLSLLFGARDEPERETRLLEVLRQLDAAAFPKRVEAVAGLLAGSGVDLVGLQEVCRWRADGVPLWDFEADLLEALEGLGDPYDVVADVPTFSGSGALPGTGVFELEGSNTVLRRRRSGVQVRSRAQGLYDTRHVLGAGEEITVEVLRGWCAVGAVDAAGRPFLFLDTHTEAYDGPARDSQRDELLRVLERWSDLPQVVVGDFNATPAEVGMPAPYVDAWAVAGEGDGWTCGQDGDLSNPASRLHDRIDYVWVRGAAVAAAWLLGAETADRTSDGLWPSDHAAVVADVELTGTP